MKIYHEEMEFDVPFDENEEFEFVNLYKNIITYSHEPYFLSIDTSEYYRKEFVQWMPFKELNVEWIDFWRND